MAAENLRLVHNGKIWSPDGLDNDLSWFTFDPSTGFIIETGKDEKTAPFDKYPEDRRKDAKGCRILPGLHESHIHVRAIGLSNRRLSLEGCDSIKNLQEKVKTHAQENPDSKWIVCDKGWEQDRLGRYPDRFDLDEVCPDRPVFLNRACHHIAVCNSKALEIAGITADTPSPEGGVFDKYDAGHPKSGEPTGIVREAPAMELFAKQFMLSSEESKSCIKDAVAECLRNGVTAAHACEYEAWNEYCELDNDGELPIRIYFSAYYSIGRDSKNFPKPGEVNSDFLSCDRIKLFADGSLGASTALLSIPYRCSQHRGVPIHPQEELCKFVHEATSKGFRLEIHVIGDGAAENALDAMEYAKVSPEKRPILTHCQILRKDLIERMRKQGVIANIQPQFVPTDARWAEKLLPPELLEYSYAWKTLLDSGVHCAGGSDAPVETPEPLQGIYDAIFRKIGSRSSPDSGIFKKEEALSVQEAIDLYTKAGAFAAMKEHLLGQIRPGYQADFVILEGDDVCYNPERFLNVKVLETWVAGKRRF